MLKKEKLFLTGSSQGMQAWYCCRKHSKEADEKEWVSEWGGQIIFSHSNSQSRGVAVLLPNSMMESCKIKDIETDQNGRALIIDCEIEDNSFTIINIYTPTKDRQKEQLQFLDYLGILLKQHRGKI